MNRPRVSLILPVYNGDAWLRQCLQSVFEQTFTDFELLVGDDASADRSREIVAGFSDSRMRVCPSDANVGLFANLNRLLREANAPLVRFLCQDDTLEPFAVAEEVAYLEGHPGVVLSICQARGIDEHGKAIREWPRSSDGPILYSSAISLQLLLYHGCIAGNLSTMCVRRALVQELGGFDETYRLAGDYDLLVRLCQRGPIVDLQKTLVKVRSHARTPEPVEAGPRGVHRRDAAHSHAAHPDAAAPGPIVCRLVHLLAAERPGHALSCVRCLVDGASRLPPISPDRWAHVT